MTKPAIDPTRSSVNPSDSILMTLARAAMAPDAGSAEVTWPTLDLNDSRQREFGDYELLEEIGRGGMGVVYRARQRSLDRDVAIKFIAAGIADSFNVARFLGEARAAARLMHPNIVPVHEVGSIDGVHYFSMPLVKGRTLADALESDPWPAHAAIALMLKLCDAIDYAHRLGLLHLDLKPANVLLDERGEPLITDFGLARHMDANGGIDTQEVSGTPSFMAPEQILIKQFRLTPATDLYALGAILYRALCGVSPHGVGQPDELTQRAIAGRVRPLREVIPQVSPDLAAVTMHCLELLPKERYATVAALSDDLRRMRDGLPVSVRAIGYIERVHRWFRREPKLAYAVSVAALALLAGAAATTWQWKQAVAAHDRASIASEIGARLYTYEGESDKRAEDLLGWLRERLPGDEERQADALTTFVSSVDAGNRSGLDNLMLEITEVLGSDYRREMIRSLRASSHPRRHLHAALLSWSDEHASPDPKTFASSLQAAIAEHPEDPLTWQVAAVYCPGPPHESHCLYPQAAETLTRLDPDNMYSWLQLALVSFDRSRAVAAVHEAAKRTRIDDYYRATMAAHFQAVESAGVAPPPLIARPAKVLAPNESPQASVALMESYHLQLPNWQPLVELCGVKVGMPAVNDPQLLADCLKVGNTLVNSEGAIITQMIGVALVRVLAKGTPDAEVAIRKRLQYQFLGALPNDLTSSQRARYTSAQHLHDLSEVGEMAAWERRMKALGLPDQMPVGWQADDPHSSLSARERHDNMRTAIRTARIQVNTGQFDDAIATLKPIDVPTRKRTADSDKVQFLVVHGRARIGLKQFAGAKKELREAWEIAQTFGPGSISAIESAQASIELHTALEAIEPGQGHAAMADNYRMALLELQPQPTVPAPIGVSLSGTAGAH